MRNGAQSSEVTEPGPHSQLGPEQGRGPVRFRRASGGPPRPAGASEMLPRPVLALGAAPVAGTGRRGLGRSPPRWRPKGRLPRADGPPRTFRRLACERALRAGVCPGPGSGVCTVCGGQARSVWGGSWAAPRLGRSGVPRPAAGPHVPVRPAGRAPAGGPAPRVRPAWRLWGSKAGDVAV